MFEDSTEALILVASYTIVLMIILIKLIKCTVQVIKEGGRGVTVEFNGTIIYCSNPDTRKCTAKDMDLIGGILSEHPSNGWPQRARRSRRAIYLQEGGLHC